ncbi:MAG: ubiquinone/menaquinone biosynthesis methyltransferase [Bacteroidales bacterium]|nr:ubiquinone/menaquinone biosynthesis methyltransferase [Bacteroidales bacterium]MDD4031370.1 ubiquinone/menaquinone biosynthesis methyltransferase [Bacteroidales bacterium]MDD4436264.1 ubiquinone/menaquinone biosynthesis methyltransferase [Bacteroidales bacterium]MDD5732640.1 ubiquinone/menaquinone biosynthesis methyltransferase [Bacteroidales bacterium]
MTSPTEISARYDLTNGIFNAIAARYERTNTLVSIGLNRLWQRRLICQVRKVLHLRILDLACGTGTLTRKLAKPGGAHVTGLDPSDSMLWEAVGRTPADTGRAPDNRNPAETGRVPDRPDIVYKKGYAESLPFADKSFQVITVSYGIRNFADRNAAFRQALRVLEPGGNLFILEFSLKANAGVWMAIQRFYIGRVLPLLGWLSTGKKEAYDYLGDTIASFPAPQVICRELEEAGFVQVSCTRLFPGVVVLFTGQKKVHNG